VLGFIGTLLSLIVNRRKNKTEVEKLIAETELARINAQHELQSQLDELREQNKRLFVDREIEREAKEKLRSELNRMHDKIENLSKELQTERERNVQLTSELERQRMSNQQKTIKIEGLEALASQHQKTIENINLELAKVRMQTGNLTQRLENKTS
jgi:predicted nuclease with TOPRIM domain